MSADVNTFLSHFTGGGARPNRYEVFISFPNFLGIRDTAIMQKISFTCEATSIPASNLGDCIVHYKGREVKVPGDRTFDDWTVTIVIDSDFMGRDIFERWSSGMLGNNSNLVNSPAEINNVNIFGQATIHALDRYDQVTRKYQVISMYPKTVSEISLGYSANNEVMKQQVTFSINGWNAYDTNGALLTK